MHIRIHDTKLTDGSTVHDVHVGEYVILRAVSYNDAKELCAKIADAIQNHALNYVESEH